MTVFRDITFLAAGPASERVVRPRRASAVGITRLGHCLDDDYPTIDWPSYAPMADLWLEIDERQKAGRPVEDLLGQIAYRLRLSRRWPRVDCLAMVPGLSVSQEARAA